MEEYEYRLSQYAQAGGGTKSITELASDYVPKLKMPYDLVSLMAQKPIEPQKLETAIEARIPSLEPTQIEAIQTLSTSSPQEIRTAMKAVMDTVDMKPYEIDGLIRELEILRVEAASMEIEGSHKLIDQQRSFLLHTMASKPKAVVWLSQAVNPVRPGDMRVVVDKEIATEMAKFAGVPVMRFDDVYGTVEMLVPGGKAVKAVKFTEQEALRLKREGVKPVYVGSSPTEVRKVMEDVVMITARESLRLRNPRASKFINMPRISEIERAASTAAGIMDAKGINFNLWSATVIPTQFTETDHGSGKISKINFGAPMVEIILIPE